MLFAGISVVAFPLACVEDTVELTATAAEKPRLVLQIAVDQPRGDLPTRYFDRFGKGGLRFN